MTEYEQQILTILAADQPLKRIVMSAYELIFKRSQKKEEQRHLVEYFFDWFAKVPIRVGLVLPESVSEKRLDILLQEDFFIFEELLDTVIELIAEWKSTGVPYGQAVDYVCEIMSQAETNDERIAQWFAISVYFAPYEIQSTHDYVLFMTDEEEQVQLDRSILFQRLVEFAFDRNAGTLSGLESVDLASELSAIIHNCHNSGERMLVMTEICMRVKKMYEEEQAEIVRQRSKLHESTGFLGALMVSSGDTIN